MSQQLDLPVIVFPCRSEPDQKTCPYSRLWYNADRKHGGCGPTVRAPVCGTGDCEFESRHPPLRGWAYRVQPFYQCAPVAQSDRVAGFEPVGCAFKSRRGLKRKRPDR